MLRCWKRYISTGNTLSSIFDIQLSSIPGLEDVKFEVTSTNGVMNGPILQSSTEPPSTNASPQSEVNTGWAFSVTSPQKYVFWSALLQPQMLTYVLWD